MLDHTGAIYNPKGIDAEALAKHCIEQRGIEVLPAILCNSGGVTVSYFEWKQNRQAEVWDESQVDALLQKQMAAAARLATQAASRFNCSLRAASYCVALEHISNVYSARGIFP